LLLLVLRKVILGRQVLFVLKVKKSWGQTFKIQLTRRSSYLLHAYALMDNYYHLLIQTLKATYHKIMQNINTSYTVYINRKYLRAGHLFQERFKGIIGDKDRYLIALSRYIHLNPVRAKIVHKPLVNILG